MDIQIVRSTNRHEAVVQALTEAGRAWAAEHFGAGATSATVPRESVPSVIRSLSDARLQWSRERGTCREDA